MPGRPRRSCDSCNAQKVRIHSNLIPEWSSFGGIVQLRCCGQKPSCQRCTRIGRSCIYTGSSTTPSRTRRRSASVVSVLQAQRPHSASLASPPLPRHIPGKRYSGIPSALLPPLIELYFSHVYNSNLTVHKPTFLKALEADNVRLDIVLSICALAAMYDVKRTFSSCSTADKTSTDSTRMRMVLRYSWRTNLAASGQKKLVGLHSARSKPPVQTISLSFSISPCSGTRLASSIAPVCMEVRVA